MGSDIQAVNVTKYLNGAQGANKIDTGYIKAVELVWLDSYVINFTSTKTTIDIAYLGPNRKITGIELMIETTLSQTSGTVGLGFSEEINAGSLFGPSTLTHNFTVSTISILDTTIGSSITSSTRPKASAFQTVTGGTLTTITLQLNNWTSTTGTIKSIVRYT